MNYTAIAIVTMIGATVLAQLGMAQQPDPEGQAGQPREGRGRGGREPAEAGSDLSKPLLPKDDGETKILEAIDQARQGYRFANVSTADGRLLRQLTEAVNAKRVVELGTSTGESGLWFAMALRKTGGHLYTHDIDPGRISVARENFKKGGVADLITIVEGDAHQTATKNTDPIDVLFLDAEKEGYDAYLKELLPFVRPGGLILALPELELVTAVEVLSPISKSRQGRRAYLEKRDELHASRVNLVEIDLLLGGTPLPMKQRIEPGAYYAIVARDARLPVAEVYRWTVRDPLPCLPIPLREPDPDILIDLGALATRVYDLGRYARTLRRGMSLPETTTLTPDDRVWVESVSRPARPEYL